MRLRRSISCPSIPRSILGSLAMAAILPWQGPRPVSRDLEEADRHLAEADLVAMGEHGLADPLAVDEDPVEAAVVEDHDHLAPCRHHGVAAGDRKVLERHVRGGRAAQVQRARADLHDHELVTVLDGEVAPGGEPW